MLKNYSKIKVDKFGNKYYVNDEGNYYRLDGPAIEGLDGSKSWYINGNRHRNINPSEEWSTKRKYWYFNNKRHRVGGSFSSTQKYWYIHGKEYAKRKYFNKVWDI